MRRATKLAAAAVGAAGVGAGLAVAHHRGRAAPLATARTAPAAQPSAAPPPPDDPQAALDAARERLRDRADELRRDIESSGEPGGA